MFVGDLAGVGHHSFAVLDVIVAEFEFLADVETDAVQQAGVRLCVIHDDVVAADKGIDGGEDALITEVELEGGLFVLEVGKLSFQLFVQRGLASHHTAAHRIGHTPAGSAFRVGFSDLGMVGQAEIVVDAPAKHVFAVETHVRAKFAFQLRECEITVNEFTILSDRTTGGFL